jgi:hypothetical protein
MHLAWFHIWKGENREYKVPSKIIGRSIMYSAVPTKKKGVVPEREKEKGYCSQKYYQDIVVHIQSYTTSITEPQTILV